MRFLFLPPLDLRPPVHSGYQLLDRKVFFFLVWILFLYLRRRSPPPRPAGIDCHTVFLFLLFRIRPFLHFSRSTPPPCLAMLLE